ncbi:glycerol-3-phosphate 1-O-acyltransferase PlsY [Niallia oryzisoli]|uniref:glycerol-3-phosphate 1-O-acyltransferase PlsY n=1 Tax=Niallia oryzisoli TaxID=1737571 RepID=UPI003736A335
MTLFISILAYVVGSIPTALIVGKVFFNIDIREHGSNNPGATNTLRVLGKRAAIIVLLVDVGKGALAASLPILFQTEMNPLYPGLIAVIGHCFPVFAGFRGGKAIATTAGALLAVNFWLFLITYITFFLVIFITKYVFFGSLSVGIVLLLYSIMEAGSENDILFIIFLLLLIFLHRTNIRNFIHHQEPKINDKNLAKDRIKTKKIQ